MEVTKEIIRTMNYVRETSYRTDPKMDEYFVEYDRNKECFDLDYSNLKCSRTNLTNEEFISFNKKTIMKSKILTKNKIKKNLSEG